MIYITRCVNTCCVLQRDLSHCVKAFECGLDEEKLVDSFLLTEY